MQTTLIDMQNNRAVVMSYMTPGVPFINTDYLSSQHGLVITNMSYLIGHFSMQLRLRLRWHSKVIVNDDFGQLEAMIEKPGETYLTL